MLQNATASSVVPSRLVSTTTVVQATGVGNLVNESAPAVYVGSTFAAQR
jgi:hypothetical protein